MPTAAPTTAAPTTAAPTTAAPTTAARGQVATAVVPSPLGDILLEARRGHLTGLRFVDPLPPGAMPAPPGAAHGPGPRREGSARVTTAVAPGVGVGEADGAVRVDPAFDAVRRWLDDYFAGRRPDGDVQVDLGGTAFQRRVWSALRAIPYGTTVTYGALAADLGHPTAARAVGAANGRNPVSILVPCHRVVGATGLTGYAWGVGRKAWLLDLERAAA